MFISPCEESELQSSNSPQRESGFLPRALIKRIRRMLRSALHFWEYRLRELKRTRPQVLRVAVTAHCNAGCTFCPIPGNATPDHMSLVDFQTLFDRLEKDLELVDFSFAGDPLINLDLFDMVAYVRAANVAVNIHTNGLALDEDRALALSSCGADVVVINLNTLTRNGQYHPQSIADFHPARVERVNRYLRYNSKTRTQVVLQLIAPPGQPHLDSRDLAGVFSLPRNAVLRLKPERDCSYDAKPPSGAAWRCYRLHQEMCVGPTGDLVTCCWDTLLRTSQGNLLHEDPAVIWRDHMNRVRGGCPTSLCHNCRDNELGAIKMLANDLLSPSWAYRVFRLLSGRKF